MDRTAAEGPLIVDVTLDWTASAGEPLIDGRVADRLARHALLHEGRSGAWTFAIRVVDDPAIASLHERYLSDPAPTDIMTFPYDGEDGEQGGDILISVETAAVNAREHGWQVQDELEFLILHGTLHVLGWDDRTRDGRDAMLARQRELMKSARQA